jgi:putative iron-regulated protein
VADALGIENVWLGRYKRADGSVLQGASLRDLVAAKDPAIADRTSTHIASTVKAAEGIHAPFDREIVEPEGRKRLQVVVEALKLQSKDFVDAAKTIGIAKLSIAEPKNK